MRRTFLVFVILFIIVTQSICFAQGTSSTKNHVTFGYPNGRFWLNLNNITKFTYLIGLVDGAKLFKGYIIDAKKICNNDKGIDEAYDDIIEIPKAELKDIVGQINSFYADSANLNIPVVKAYEIAGRKFKGESPKDIEEFIAELRRLLNN